MGGPIAKNIAVRAESELSDGKAVDLHNYAVAFSNLLKSDGLLNLRVGGFTHGEWLSIGDNRRAFDPYFNIYRVTSAHGRVPTHIKSRGQSRPLSFTGIKGLLFTKSAYPMAKVPVMLTNTRITGER